MFRLVRMRIKAARSSRGCRSTTRPAWISLSSPGLTCGCSAGSSRNQRNQAAAHTKPMAPKTTKTIRQGITQSKTVTSRPVKPASEMGTGKEDPLRSASLGQRQPPREGLRDIGKRAGFAHAEEETNHEQRRIVESRRRRDREARPPDHDPRQEPSGADPVAPGSTGDFKHGVRQRERAEDVRHLRFAQAQVVHHERSCLSNANAIEIGDSRQGHRDGHHLYRTCEPPGESNSGSVVPVDTG